MLFRRLCSLSRLATRNSRNIIQTKRKCHMESWVYRSVPPKASKWSYFLADGMNCFMWWWIFVHFWYQPGHVFGEYDYPEPEKWTDTELGIVEDLD